MKKRLLCALLLAVMLLSCFVGCGKKLNVDLNGGSLSGTAKDLETLVSMTPTKEGYEFAGWYADAAYTTYLTANSLTKDQKKAGVAYAKFIKVEEVTYDVRASQVTVTDAGTADNPMDTVYLSDHYNLTDLKRAGYSTLEVVITMQVAEKDDGYQHILLYKNQSVVREDKSVIGWLDKTLFGENENDDPSRLFSYAYEHGPDVLNTSWEELTVTTRVKISDLESDLFLRYDASGSGADTWYNKDVTVKIIPKK